MNTINIQIDHPNAKRMEHFLNHVKERLEEIPFVWKSLQGSERMSGACKFMSAGEAPVTITVLFCDSYQDANKIANVNAFPITPHAKWGVNGDLLYVVESNDQDKVSAILGLFAGEE